MYDLVNYKTPQLFIRHSTVHIIWTQINVSSNGPEMKGGGGRKEEEGLKVADKAMVISFSDTLGFLSHAGGRCFYCGLHNPHSSTKETSQLITY